MTERQTIPVSKSLLREFDPFRDMLRYPGAFSRLLRSPWGEGLEAGQWAPAMDVAESKDGYTVTVEVAGAKKPRPGDFRTNQTFL